MITAQTFKRGSRPRPFLMGILNVTPDSFSDGGKWDSPKTALAHALDLIEQGADIIDIGGESTRPGATPVSQEEELSRLLPVLKELIPSIDVPVSVDTMKADVAEACVALGASIINDVSGLGDPDMAMTVADCGVPLVLMSSYGDPSTFRTQTIPGDGVLYAREKLAGLTEKALDAGVREEMIILDPGIGFGTSPGQATEMLAHSSDFSLGRYPVLIGPSRKRFLSHAFPGKDPDAATAEACEIAASSGADILRVHDVGRAAERF